MTSTARSQTPLHRKLGYVDNASVLLVDKPPNYTTLLGPGCPHYLEVALETTEVDLVHIFVRARAPLESAIPFLRTRIAQNGAIWVSWPKKSAKVATDLTEDVVRSVALASQLVDVKVCSVDATWSALKLVIPRRLRTRD